MKKHASGTKEWSTSSVNVSCGCRHDCRYCYAKAQAIRFGRSTPEDWKEELPIAKAVEKGYGKRSGRVMLPTTHDVTEGTVEAVGTVARKLLQAGNELLIVSKPRLHLIQRLVNYTGAKIARERVTFRFTIGSYRDSTLAYWEPGAPAFHERLAALIWCHAQGWNTSVSCEPMLEDAEGMVDLVNLVAPFVSDTIWLGKMNQIGARLSMNVVGAQDELQELAAHQERIEHQQCDGRILELYAALKNHPLVRWKESIKKVVGIPLEDESGTDR